MGSFSASKAGTAGVNAWTLRLDYTTSQSTTATTISLKLYIVNNTGEAYNNYSNSAYYKLGQGTVGSLSKQYFTYNYTSKGTYLLGSKTLTITDPTVTSVTVSGAWHSIETAYTPGDITVTGNITFAALKVPLTVTNIDNFYGSVGQKKTFSVTASGGTSPYTYKWYLKSGTTSTVISGATSSSYTRTFIATDNEKYIYCEVTDSASASVTTNEALLEVYSAPKLEQVNFVQIRGASKWVQYIPWIYTNHGWKVCRWVKLSGADPTSAIADIAIADRAVAQ